MMLYVVAIGSPDERSAIAEKLTGKGAKFATLIHPKSYVAASAKIGTGSIIAPFVFIGPEAHVGKHCILNTHVCVGHEVRMDDGCVLSPFAALHGTAKLGTNVFVGGNAIVTAGQNIGNGARITAGSVVYSPVPAGALAIGNPAALRNK
jgi:acetyltransferase EpsM